MYIHKGVSHLKCTGIVEHKTLKTKKNKNTWTDLYNNSEELKKNIEFNSIYEMFFLLGSILLWDFIRKFQYSTQIAKVDVQIAKLWPCV